MRNWVSRLMSAFSSDFMDMAGDGAGMSRGEERQDGNETEVDPEGLVKASASFSL